jgi:7-cyano-7-deazaguanine synthase
MKSVVVFSGGQDSTTCLAAAIDEAGGARDVLALSINYGQRHTIELEAAASIASFYGVQHETVNIGPILLGTSPLTDPTAELETYSSAAEMDKIIGNRREATFVPMRNALFLTIAANRAAVHGAQFIWTGVCEMDNANYDDCRSEFIKRVGDMITYSNGADHRDEVQRIHMRAPLMFRSKAETIRYALGLPGCYMAYAYSHTAYSGEFPPRTQDHATVLRASGFADAGIPDPMIVRGAYEYESFELPVTGNYDSAWKVIRKAQHESWTTTQMLTELEKTVGAKSLGGM